jgi:hypothetical protein
MANTVLSASIIAAEAVEILDNNLVMAKQVFRGYEEEFNKNPNGYTVGDTITIRKPTDFTVRDGSVMSAQDVTEASTTIQVNKFKGVDFRFTSQQLTLNIKELSDRVIKPAMVQLANQIDSDLMALYAQVPSWVGTPGQTINSFADFALGPQRMDEYANPSDGRTAVLSPADHWGMLGSQTALYMQDVAKGAYREATLGNIGGVNEFMSQNVPTFTVGTRTASGATLINGSYTAANATAVTAANLTTNTQTYAMDTFTGATDTVKAGEVFTIAGVYAVNPVTKAALPFLKQFVVTTDFTASSNAGNVTFSPMPVWSGPFQNVSVQGVTDLNNQAVTFLGTASTGYKQNLIFTQNAFALVSVPLVSPPGAVDVSRQSYKGTNVRVIPVYDGINDVSAWRLDVLYGTKAIDPRKAHRLSGSP